jgi:hypothetical protein
MQKDAAEHSMHAQDARLLPAQLQPAQQQQLQQVVCLSEGQWGQAEFACNLANVAEAP